MQAALSYLSASGAVSVSSISGIGISRQWMDKKHERKVVRTAQQLLLTDQQDADAALNAAAMLHGVTLTPDIVAVERAAQASRLLDQYLQGGLLRAFNSEYARRRRAGQTRMSFPAARARFVRLLVFRLNNGSSSAGLIDEVLNL